MPSGLRVVYMPDGQTHERLRATFSPIIALESIGLLLIDPDPVSVGALWSGYLSGRYVEPDLDINIMTESELRVTQDFGFFIGWLWGKYWYPYAKIIPHRHWLSHGAFISTILRLVYLLSPMLFVISLLSTSWFMDYSYTSKKYLLQYYIGLAQADLIHIIADHLHKGHHT